MLQLARPRRKRPRTLIDFVARGAVDARLAIGRKSELFEHFAARLAADCPALEAQSLARAFRARERQLNTAVGRGVALPHAIVREVDRAMVGVFTTARPVDYRAADRERVDVFFAIVGPASDRATHLHLLSTIARLSLKTDLLTRLRAAESPREILLALADCSAAMRAV